MYICISEKVQGEKSTIKTACEENKQRKYNCHVIIHGLTCSDDVLLYCTPSSFVKIGGGVAALRAHMCVEQSKVFAHPSGRVVIHDNVLQYVLI